MIGVFAFKLKRITYLYYMQHRIDHLINHYELEAHPEGGWFKEVYRSKQNMLVNTIEERQVLTSIYFLLSTENVSKFHSIKSDELWYYHSGSALTVHCINPEGNYYQLKIGPDFNNGEQFQAIVPKGTIFGSTVDEPDKYSFVGCAVAPGFDFKDFKLFKESELMKRFPQHENIIKKLT